MPNDRLEQLTNLLKSVEDQSFILFALAKEYQGQGDNNQALNHYLKVLKGYPNYLGTYYHLGKLYEEMGDPNKAKKTYKSGIELARDKDAHALSELEQAMDAMQG